MLVQAQLECYRDVLARRFDVLADPKRPRHSAQRTSEMRALCAELRKVTIPCRLPTRPTNCLADGFLLPALSHCLYPAPECVYQHAWNALIYTDFAKALPLCQKALSPSFLRASSARFSMAPAPSPKIPAACAGV